MIEVQDRRAILKRVVAEYGLDIIAVDTAKKNEAKIKNMTFFKESKNNILKESLTTEQYLKKIDTGIYDGGCAIICRQIRRGKYAGHKFIFVDIDLKEGVRAFLDTGDRKLTLEELADKQYVEFNGVDRDQRIHIPYLLEPDAEIAAKGADDKVGIEVNINGVMFGAGSPHHNGGFYERLGKASEIRILDRTQAFMLQGHIASVCQKYRVNYSGNNEQKKEEWIAYLHDDATRIKKGGRHEVIKFISCSYFTKYADEWDKLTDDQRFERVLEYDKMHCEPPLNDTDPQEVLDIWDWTKKTLRRSRDDQKEAREDEKRVTEERYREDLKGLSEEKHQSFISYPGEIQNALSGNIWTMTSEEPYKFIVGVSRRNHICKAYTQYSEVGKSKVLKLYRGTIIIKCLPVMVVVCESPLTFLESSTKYTITFRNQLLKEFAVTGSISEILSYLGENGYIVSEYGAKEALNSMITAFRDDGRIAIDRSVDFEGYYYHDGDIHVSKIDINKKHPARTKEECIACIKFINELSAFYLWKHKESEIDRRDLLASAIKWTIAAPFNFAIKQLTRKWQKGFDMTGERDGGKSEMAHLMLDIHGNFRDENSSSDSIYSVSSGSMNTEAKFGKGMSRTTYPIEISEFGRIEAYGRNESMVEIVKKAIEDLTVRRGRDGVRYDALFPSCSSIILNGNPFISKKGEILKRLHVVKFSEEDRHEANDPRTQEFNKLLNEGRHKLKVLGDWTIRYILENKDELLLSRKYSCYDLGWIALEKFYEFAGVEVPEWLTKWIEDTSLVELDTDEESIIRSILFDVTHKTLQNNARLLEMQNEGMKITLEQRISLCLDNDLWSWIRKIKEEEKYYIDGSILELFANRLPDLTLKKLGEKMNVKYSQDTSGRRVLVCSRVDIINFIKGAYRE
jgi:hypothetical protein